MFAQGLIGRNYKNVQEAHKLRSLLPPESNCPCQLRRERSFIELRTKPIGIRTRLLTVAVNIFKIISFHSFYYISYHISFFIIHCKVLT